MFNPIADFISMRRDIVERSRLISAWGFLLNVPTLVGALIFSFQPAGPPVAAAILLSLVIATQMHKRWPLSRLMGLCHIVFLPAIYILVREFETAPLASAYGLWVAYALALMSLCVLIDLFDLFRYFVLGNRSYGKHSA